MNAAWTDFRDTFVRPLGDSTFPAIILVSRAGVLERLGRQHVDTISRASLQVLPMSSAHSLITSTAACFWRTTLCLCDEAFNYEPVRSTAPVNVYDVASSSTSSAKDTLIRNHRNV
jgi:hypothetical protein